MWPPDRKPTSNERSWYKHTIGPNPYNFTCCMTPAICTASLTNKRERSVVTTIEAPDTIHDSVQSQIPSFVTTFIIPLFIYRTNNEGVHSLARTVITNGTRYLNRCRNWHRGKCFAIPVVPSHITDYPATCCIKGEPDMRVHVLHTIC
jgi:hypothetical protein